MGSITGRQHRIGEVNEPFSALDALRLRDPRVRWHDSEICNTEGADMTDPWMSERQVVALERIAEQLRIANLIGFLNNWTDDEVLPIDAAIRKGLGLPVHEGVAL